jgi:hypothetical protein
MGEVYRARDTRLGREVALKVLPAAMSFDPARRARFEQEARAAAALNHPNIIGLHDVGEADNRPYLAFRKFVAGRMPADCPCFNGASAPRAMFDVIRQLVRVAGGLIGGNAWPGLRRSFRFRRQGRP